MQRICSLILCGALPLLGCNRLPPVGGDSDGGVFHRDLPGAKHLASCDDSACGDGFNPPVGGDHCPTWLPCRKYDTAQKRCNWLHNLEHGHAVLAWNCPQGCPEIVEALNALWQTRQADTQQRRIIVTPDPSLPKRVAAMVWGYGWVSDEYGEASILEVLSHQDEEAPEKRLGCEL